MQQDDTSKNEFDDDLDDDMDFDSQDDEALDESWDDDAQDVNIQDLDVEEAEDKPSAQKEKTFLQKNFMFIAGGIGVVLAAVFVLPMLMNKPASVPMDTPEQTAQQDAPPVGEIGDLQNDIPPMPAPISGITEEAAQNAPAGEDAAILTPMPETAADQPPPAPLEIEQADAAAPVIPDLPPEPAPVLSEEKSAPLEVAQAEAPPSPIPDLPVEAPALLEPENAPLEIEQADAAAPVIPDLPPEPLESAPIDTPALEKTVSTPVVSDTAPNDQTQALEAQKKEQLKQETDALEAKKREEEEKAKQAELKAKMKAEAKAKAEEEKKQVEIAAQKAKEQEAKKLAESASAPKAKPAEASAPPPAEKPMQKKPKPESKAAPLANSWVLRSARPGRAMVANTKSGDILTIETGETVKGLGKILSVAQENGKWVVRTSLGFISQ